MTIKKPKEYEKQLPDGTVLDGSHIEILKKLNDAHTHVVFGGKNIIIGIRTCQVQGSVFTFETLPEFRNEGRWDGKVCIYGEKGI